MRKRFCAALCLVWVVFSGVPVLGQPTGGPDTWDLPTLYARACSACHGPLGEGLAEDNPVFANFEPPPADLTDPLFNSREPAGDWFLVVKYGGARMGLSQQMPAFGEGLTDERIEELVGYIKTLADSAGYPQGDLNFPRPIRTIKAFPEDEFLVLSRYERRPESESGDALRGTLYYAHRLARRGQYEVKLSSTSFDEASSEEELELGLKWTVLADLDRTLLAAVGGEVEVPLESGADEVFIPYFSLGKGLGDAFTFQTTLRGALPVDDVGDGKVEFSGIVHWLPGEFPRGPMPALEAIVSRPFEGGDTQWSLIPQVLIGLSKGGHVAASFGVELPDSDQPYDYRIHFFLLWDYADGPFWKGW
jgi:hypothetical protein